ncbi:MAG: hypothetical protein KGK15_18205 [Burkholderiales bacterium]|nr:hypothetical protein [Burkholderiales bacterium]
MTTGATIAVRISAICRSARAHRALGPDEGGHPSANCATICHSPRAEDNPYQMIRRAMLLRIAMRHRTIERFSWHSLTTLKSISTAADA